MAKKKRKSKKKQESKLNLKYELSGLLCVAISIIAVLQLGVVGQTFVYLFRFFAGEWFILCLIGLFLLGISLFWKKKSPSLLTRRKAGLYCIIASILLLSHVQLFKNLSHHGSIRSASVIGNTWELFMIDMKQQAASPDLGGGMIGAVLFAASHFLFASTGSQIMAIVLILMGLILVTGRSLQETLKKWTSPVGRFIRSQWQAFLEDMKTVRTNMSSPKTKTKSGKKQKRVQKKKEMPEPEEEDEEIISPIIHSEPIISSFSDRQEERVEPLIPEKTQETVQTAKDEPSGGAQDSETAAAPPMTFTELENKDYQMPSLDILADPKHTGQQTDKKNIYENARKLERAASKLRGKSESDPSSSRPGGHKI